MHQNSEIMNLQRRTSC